MLVEAVRSTGEVVILEVRSLVIQFVTQGGREFLGAVGATPPAPQLHAQVDVWKPRASDGLLVPDSEVAFRATVSVAEAQTAWQTMSTTPAGGALWKQAGEPATQLALRVLAALVARGKFSAVRIPASPPKLAPEFGIGGVMPAP